MPATDLALLKEAAKEAGAIASKYFNAAPTIWDKGGGLGPVTEADLAVDAHLRARLTAARPDYGWLSEETADTNARQSTRSQFIVDPIDGTRAFIEGSRDWAHSLAVVTDGVVEAAVVFMPMRKTMYTAHRGNGAALNGQPLRVAPVGDKPTVLTARPNLEAHHWRDGQTPDLERHFRSSLAYRLCLVAEGKFDSMLTLRASWEWDIAAGALIVTEAGGTVSDRSGAPLKFNNPLPQVDGVIAAHPDVHRMIADRLL